jgi:methylmalonyl-CoA/ethylmalonyl-CoA epimerase
MIPNDFGLSFHHFGLASKEPSLARHFLEKLGYLCDAEANDPLQNINYFMGRHEAMPAVEVLFPAPSKGPLDAFLGRHPEGIVYHLCFQSADAKESLVQMRAAGLKVLEISPPKPAPQFGNKPISFYLITGIGLIEILEA